MQSTPDTTPGVHPSQSVSVAGTVSEIKLEGGWFYKINSIHHSRNSIWVPEYRLRLISKSIFDDVYMEPRAGLQRQLTDDRDRAKKWKRRFAEVNAEVPVLEGEL